MMLKAALRLVTIDSIDASDPDNIDESYECDGIVDCENWSDEGFQCGSSLAVAYIVIGILLVLMVLIVLFFLITVAYYHKRGRVRATGPLFLYLVCGASIVGILSVFTFYGRAKDFPCVFRYWLVFPAAIVLTRYHYKAKWGQLTCIQLFVCETVSRMARVWKQVTIACVGDAARFAFDCRWSNTPCLADFGHLDDSGSTNCSKGGC